MKNGRQEGDDSDGDNERNTEPDADDGNGEWVFTESDDEKWEQFVLSENVKNAMDDPNSEECPGKNVTDDDDDENPYVRLCCFS